MGTTVAPLLRNVKGSPLSISEVDANFSAIATKLGEKVDESAYTDALVLTKIKNVDGPGSGLDADTVDGLNPTATNINSSIVSRDASGNFSASNITANLIGDVTGGLTGNVTGNVTGNLTGDADNALSLGGLLANLYALKASPALSGTPTAPTASSGTNNTQIATTAFVATAINLATTALGTMSSQNSNSVSITGGTITNTTVNGVTVGSNASNAKTISNLTPSGGSNGDVWYRV